jgi:glycosyltransferase involved in cell wall biosynthesis
VVKTAAFAVPGDLATPTGGYTYDRRIVQELTSLGWSVEVVDIGGDFPRPSPATRAAARARLAAIPPGQPIVIDGLALGVLPEVAAVLSATHPLVALVHHPLALESGLSASEADAMRKSECMALAYARHVIVTSPATARLLGDEFAVPADRITVAPPGTDRATRSRGSSDGTVALLAVGSLVPRKGYDVLIQALATLRDLPWRLTIAGDARDAKTACQVEAGIATLNLKDRIVLLGAVAQAHLDDLYDEADVFVLASRYEGYGMAYAQAIARGVPVIGTTGGAIPDTVPKDAGILVPPDDSQALAAALRRIIAAPGERARLADAAWAAANRLPTWRSSAETIAHIIEALA